MNVLVTGGAGYVGSHCVRSLCDSNIHVVVYDNLVAGGHRGAVDPRAELVEGDLNDRRALTALVSGRRFDAVVHFAGSLNVNESVSRPLEYYRNNVINTINLLELMRDSGVRKIVFSSTCAVYGVPGRMPITEDAPLQPISPYGRTKLAVEWALRDCAAAWGLGATSLRYFNAAGASERGGLGEDRVDEYHLVPLVLAVALGHRKDVKIFGTDYPTRDGTCVRDYIHVDDLATVHRRAVETQGEGTFRAYNVGTGQGVSVLEVIEVARQVTGHPIPTTPAPRRSGDPPELYADASKLMREFAWKPKHASIRQIVESAWKWHRDHPLGFDKL